MNSIETGIKTHNKVKVKVNFTLEQATKAQRGVEV
jgi:flavin-binding protein dodecin